MKIVRWVSDLERYCHEGDCIPLGWGYCRPSVYRQDYCLIAPIPLNFIIGFGHWFYWRVLVRGWGMRGAGFEGLRHYWINEGKRRGYNEGYEAGVRHTQAALDPEAYARWRRNVAFVNTYRAPNELVRRSVLDTDEVATDRDSRPGDSDRECPPACAPDACATDRPGTCGMPCSGGGSQTAVPEGLPAGRPEVRPDALDHRDRAGAHAVRSPDAEGTVEQPTSLVDNGRADHDDPGDGRVRQDGA